MRMRRKPNLIPRLDACADYIIAEPSELIGKWKTAFPSFSELHLELGCGKGRFTCETARANADVLLIGVERVPDAAVVAAERTRDAALDNARFVVNDVNVLATSFERGEVSRIYINFCDPWPKSRYAKRRLTSDAFLTLYKTVLLQGGEVHFKTDNNPLFEYSIERFEACGYALSEVTRDLHADGIRGIMTDYEAKFHAEGVKINRCVATVL